MATLNSRKSTAPKAAKTVSDLIVRRSKQEQKAAPMFTADIVPAGTYHSTIVAVDSAHGDDGKLLADVTYRLVDDRGKAVEARARYPVGGFHLQKLFDALIDAGLPEDSPLVDAVGIEESVTITYPFEGALGKIKERCPVAAVEHSPSKSQKTRRPAKKLLDVEDLADEDEEEDDLDFLEDEDS